MDRLAAMQTFVRVAEAGSFTAVADQMDVARSAVTRQIAGLEAHLGVKLIARSTLTSHPFEDSAAEIGVDVAQIIHSATCQRTSPTKLFRTKLLPV